MFSLTGGVFPSLPTDHMPTQTDKRVAAFNAEHPT